MGGSEFLDLCERGIVTEHLLFVALPARKVLLLFDDSGDLLLGEPIAFDHGRIVRGKQARRFAQGGKHRGRHGQISHCLPRRLDTHEVCGQLWGGELWFERHGFGSLPAGLTAVIMPLNCR
jgi:hypothetical protein